MAARRLQSTWISERGMDGCAPAVVAARSLNPFDEDEDDGEHESQKEEGESTPPERSSSPPGQDQTGAGASDRRADVPIKDKLRRFKEMILLRRVASPSREDSGSPQRAPDSEDGESWPSPPPSYRQGEGRGASPAPSRSHEETSGKPEVKVTRFLCGGGGKGKKGGFVVEVVDPKEEEVEQRREAEAAREEDEEEGEEGEEEDGEQGTPVQRKPLLPPVPKKTRSYVWSSVLTVVLIEGRDVRAADADGVSGAYSPAPDPRVYVKFRLGNEKYKSRPAARSCHPTWREQFDLHFYRDTPSLLELGVWDADRPRGYIGGCKVELERFQREKTHQVELPLEEGTGRISLLLTVSGIAEEGVASDLSSYVDDPARRAEVRERYSLLHTFSDMQDVGQLTVKVFRARGLAAADLSGRSDPFCVLELVNYRVQTHTEYRTLNPCWDRIFTFQVKDVHVCLDISVYDEDRDGKFDFLGRVLVPLYRILNGKKRWYALKDRKLCRRAKGSNPQILLEMELVFNPIRAMVRTFRPKECKYVQPEVRFKRQLFLRNVARVRNFAPFFVDVGRYIKSCFQWESTVRSTMAFVLFLTATYFFQPYMLPLLLLLLYLKNYIVWSVNGWMEEDRRELWEDEDDDAEDEKGKEEKKSLKDKLQAVQDITLMVQTSIGEVASLAESFINTFNFTVPFLSYIAIFVLSLATLILYFVPLRYLVMAWGINKFSKKLLRPKAIPNNELLDFLSRVPNKEDLVKYRDLRPTPLSDADKRKAGKHKSGGSFMG